MSILLSFEAYAELKTSSSTWPSRSSSVANIIGSPFFVRMRLHSAIMPPTVTHSPSPFSARSFRPHSTFARRARPHLLQRVRGEEEAERLLLPLVELLAVVGGGRHGWVLLAERIGPAACDRLGVVEDRPLAELRVLLRLRAGALRLRQDPEHSGTRRAERVERA